MNCRCGAVMISDGKVWKCPFGGNTNYQHDPSVDDKRLTIGRSVTVVREPGPVGEPRLVRTKDALHAGILECCQACNPAGYLRARYVREIRRGR